jgi:hypothetical protein
MEIAEWIAAVGDDYGAQGKDFKEYHKEATELLNYVRSFAKEMQAGELADEESDAYDIFIDNIAEIMREYEEAVFYDKLVHKLAVRDCVKRYGNAYLEMDDMERMKKQLEFAEKYEDEIYENGVEKVGIVG